MSSSEFKPATLADWQAAAAKSLKGASPEQLNWHTPEGLTVKPLYTAEDTQSLPYTNTLPGFEPFIRGSPTAHREAETAKAHRG